MTQRRVKLNIQKLTNKTFAKLGINRKQAFRLIRDHGIDHKNMTSVDELKEAIGHAITTEIPKISRDRIVLD